MSGTHLTVPDSTYNAEVRAAGDPSNAGRPRSGSQRSITSQRSQRSQRSQPSLTPAARPEIDFSRRPSISIQRPSSRQSETRNSERGDNGYFAQLSPGGLGGLGRPRSTSQPASRDFASPDPTTTARSARQSTYMPDILEGTTSQVLEGEHETIQPIDGVSGEGSASRPIHPPLRHARTNIGIVPPTPPPKDYQDSGEYESQLIELLDLVDPEVSTLTTLTNVQNSLFVPDLGRYLNRRPTYVLSRRAPTIPSEDESSTEDGAGVERFATAQERPGVERLETTQTMNTITSNVNDRYFAVLPHGVGLRGWSEEDKLELNDHVRHMLHSRRSKFKRSMKGFGQYVKKPLGFFVTLYATLITLFGLAWVLFLIGWINVEGRQSYLINVIDNVLVALFAVVGDGLAPFRAVDTYHMCFIAHYHHLTWRLRRERSLPKLQDRSDLPAVVPSDGNAAEKQQEEFSVLNSNQQKKLEHHQKKFSKSHSFYKPHETTTHKAFPLRLLVAVVVLLDCHSLLQISLGACTWGISYHVRPFALTTVILCCSITCNITAGILISVGDHKTRKKDVIERMFRQQLTEEAMRKVEKKKQKDLEKDLAAKGLGSELTLRQEMSKLPVIVPELEDKEQK